MERLFLPTTLLVAWVLFSTAGHSSEPAPAELRRYQQLKTTCHNWQRWYRQDRSELSRINMNDACRRATSAARKIPGLKPPKSITAKPANKPRKDKHRSASSKRQSSSKKRQKNRIQQLCNRWQQQLKKVQSQLRKGYTEPKGNSLRKKRRSLSDKLHKQCR